MNEPKIENGFAVVEAGTWAVGRGQPCAATGKFSVNLLKGFIVPDRRELLVLQNEGEAYLASCERPFITHLPSVEKLSVVSSKVLVAPFKARTDAKLLKIIPLSFREAVAVTRLATGWVVAATKSRLKRIVLKEGEVLCVKREAAVAWTGKDPVGVAGRVKLRDMFIPKRKASLSLDFYGPQIVWVEGSNGI
jgi:uncharacterized protein (AIM24 family)